VRHTVLASAVALVLLALGIGAIAGEHSTRSAKAGVAPRRAIVMRQIAHERDHVRSALVRQAKANRVLERRYAHLRRQHHLVAARIDRLKSAAEKASDVAFDAAYARGYRAAFPFSQTAAGWYAVNLSRGYQRLVRSGYSYELVGGVIRPYDPLDTSGGGDCVSSGDGYINSDGNWVPSPCTPIDGGGAPAGATAQCADGSYSYSQHASGTCSWHGGVSEWLP
jgi:Protein of unknown function (DUF3761)